MYNMPPDVLLHNPKIDNYDVAEGKSQGLISNHQVNVEFLNVIHSIQGARIWQ